jgi:molecular chaperone DnaK
MIYDFYRFNWKSFEALVQALAQKSLGDNAIVFGDGADGGRELTFVGTKKFPNDTIIWDGYWVVQAKFKEKDHHKDDNFAWVERNFKLEMKPFVEKKRRIPNNYLFFTNAFLTPVAEVGGRDKIEKLKEEYKSIIPNIAILGYDELCALVTNNTDVRHVFTDLLTPGDVLAEIMSFINKEKTKLALLEGEIREKNIVTSNDLEIGQHSPVLGIDFGTSYSLAGIITKDSKCNFIPSDKGRILIPSIVTFFKNGNYIVGSDLLCGINSNEIITVSNIKRELGTNKLIKVFDKMVKPEDIVSLILKSIKANAEEYLGYEVNEALISKPANFNLNQTQCLIKAFELAGFKVRRVMTEASCACLVYNTEYSKDDDQIGYMTIDLGGGTLDISVVLFGDEIFEVEYLQGDNHLGGTDFDRCIFNFIVEQMKMENINMSSLLESKLKYEASRVKKALGEKNFTTIEICDIDQGNGNLKDFSIEITRDKFDALTKDLILRIENHINIILAKINDKTISKSVKEIESVLFTGQGTKIFNVNALIRNRFPNASIIEDFCENAVCTGVSLYSGVMTGIIKNKLLLDVNNNGVGIKCMLTHDNFIKGSLVSEKVSVKKLVISTNSLENNQFQFVLEPDTTIPTKSTFDIYIQNNTNDSIGFLEFYEFSNSDDKKYLIAKAEFILSKSISNMKLVFDVDANGIMTLFLKDDENKLQQIKLNMNPAAKSSWN